MSAENKGGEIVPFKLKGTELDIKFEVPSKTDLSLKHLKGIFNAWERGTMVDRYGRIWICQTELHNVLRITKENARYYLLAIEEKYQIETDGNRYILGSEIYRLLDILIQASGSVRTAEYAKYSDSTYRLFRDSHQAENIRAKYYETIKLHKRTLKATRIKQLKLKNDELTGKPLREDCEFSHIKDSKIFLHLADKFWNGLVLNKETHVAITDAEIKDEEQLLNLCEKKGWNKNWYPVFSKSLESYQ